MSAATGRALARAQRATAEPLSALPEGRAEALAALREPSLPSEDAEASCLWGKVTPPPPSPLRYTLTPRSARANHSSGVTGAATDFRSNLRPPLRSCIHSLGLGVALGRGVSGERDAGRGGCLLVWGWGGGSEARANWHGFYSESTCSTELGHTRWLKIRSAQTRSPQQPKLQCMY